MSAVEESVAGFGRTGGKWFGIEHWRVTPDIMTMAKGIANGLPLGATIATPEIAASLKALTISTIGGNPISAAAANATLQVMEDEHLPANAEAMGALLRDGLTRLQRKYPRTIGDGPRAATSPRHLPPPAPPPRHNLRLRIRRGTRRCSAAGSPTAARSDLA